MLQCARLGNGSHSHGNSCFNSTYEIPANHYYVACWLTYLSMAPSLAFYVIGIVFLFDSTNITEEFLNREVAPDESERREQMLKFWLAVKNVLLKIVIKLFIIKNITKE